MPIEIANSDSSFFSVDCDDLKTKARPNGRSADRFFNQDTISFTVVEEWGKGITGNIQIHDENNFFSDLFRNGMRFELAWGYKKWGKTPVELEYPFNRKNELRAAPVRRGVKCIIQSPSGNGGSNGGRGFTCGFYSADIFQSRTDRVWEQGYKSDIITQLMRDLDIADANQKIDFQQGKEQINPLEPVRQAERSWQTLYKLAIRWGAVFHVGYDSKGIKQGLFVDLGKIKDDWAKKITGARGDTRTVEYCGGINNVIEYSWQQHVGEGGAGDSVRITPTYVTGPEGGVKYSFQRYEAANEKVETWLLNQEAVKRAFSRMPSLQGKTELLIELLSRKSFDEIKNEFFILSVSTTAPQGYGYSVNLKMLGDPMMTVPMSLRFGEGFPSRLRQTDKDGNVNKKIDMMAKKVEHKIDASGYRMDVEVIDAFTLNGGVLK